MISCSYRANRLALVAGLLRGYKAAPSVEQAIAWLDEESDRIEKRVHDGLEAALAGPWWEQAAEIEGGCPL